MAHITDSSIAKVGSRDLPWEQGFPASYEWIQTSNDESHILIAKSKATPEENERKRGAEDASSDVAEKRPRF